MLRSVFWERWNEMAPYFAITNSDCCNFRSPCGLPIEWRAQQTVPPSATGSEADELMVYSRQPRHTRKPRQHQRNCRELPVATSAIAGQPLFPSELPSAICGPDWKLAKRLPRKTSWLPCGASTREPSQNGFPSGSAKGPSQRDVPPDAAKRSLDARITDREHLPCYASRSSQLRR